jgi:hypothetical protein
MRNSTKGLLQSLAIIAFVVMVAFLMVGCGSDSSNPFNPDTAGEFCDVRGGVQLIEGGYIYCNNGEYIEEDAL